MANELRFPDRIHLIDRLKFAEHCIFNQDIQPQSLVENDTVVSDGHGHLTLHS